MFGGVPTQGGMSALWAANGRRIYHRTLDKMMAEAIETKPALQAGSPRVAFEGRYWHAGRDHDVSPAGDPST